jgi:cellulose synthase/poly-beta-1,6-N-acetylglucosamine synthase-like glycosyltransferase/peptidoglycan/xylan/chitin deacetylase (PgdA/CDA1 family)
MGAMAAMAGAPGSGKPRPPRPAARWGRWIVVALILGVVASSLLIRQELAVRPAAAAAGVPARGSLPGPVLTPPGTRPATPAAEPGTISLIFDGGPDAVVTARIVAALRHLGVRATFFVRGDQVAAARSVLRAEVLAGDEIGLTGFTGDSLSGMPAWRFNAELAETQYALLQAGGPGTTLVSPPGASTVRALTAGTLSTAQRLARRGYVVVLADRAAQSAARPSVVLARLHLAGAATASGPGLVLGLAASGRPGAAALAALPRLVGDLRARGYRFTTISQAFRVPAPPVRVSWLNGAGEHALLIAGHASGAVAAILQWAFTATALIIGFRLILMAAGGAVHRARYRLPPRPWRGPVSVVIPAYNERENIARTVRSMLDSDYPDLEVIVIDDGSTDGTSELLASLRLPVTIVRQPNAGKAAALNTGVRHARHDILVFADGDTIFEPGAIAELVAPFHDRRVGGVAGKVSVANRGGLLGMLQHVEYVASSLDRRMSDVLGCMLTIPGAIGAFRRSAIEQVGGVPTNTLAEDTDLTVAMGCAGWRIRFASGARAWTEAPGTLGQLWSQRHRWAYGTLQTLWKYRGVIVSPRGRWSVAWFGLPYLATMAGVLPLISPAADLYVLFYLWASPWHALRWYVIFLAVQGTLTLWSLIIEREPLRQLWTVPAQVLVYRQLMYLVIIHALADAVTGVRLRWHKMPRIGIELAPDGQPVSERRRGGAARAAARTAGVPAPSGLPAGR